MSVIAPLSQRLSNDVVPFGCLLRLALPEIGTEISDDLVPRSANELCADFGTEFRLVLRTAPQRWLIRKCQGFDDGT